MRSLDCIVYINIKMKLKKRNVITFLLFIFIYVDIFLFNLELTVFYFVNNDAFPLLLKLSHKQKRNTMHNAIKQMVPTTTHTVPITQKAKFASKVLKIRVLTLFVYSQTNSGSHSPMMQ